MKYELKKTIKPSDIYFKEDARSLSNFLYRCNITILAFRPPVAGESFIATNSTGIFVGTDICFGNYFGDLDARFIIVKALEGTLWE
jgi:hypothetical protein